MPYDPNPESATPKPETRSLKPEGSRLPGRPTGSVDAIGGFSPSRGQFPFALLFLLFFVGACVTTTPTAPVVRETPMLPPMPPPVPTVSSELPTGSLWSTNTGSLFKDIKAKRIGDIVTITVSEEAKGSKTADTKTTRDKEFDGMFKFAGAGVGPSGVASPSGAATFGPYQGQFGTTFGGSGSTSRTGSMSAYMTATVVDVLPNGNMLIRGSRWTKVNDEMQQIILEGMVRPNDITRNNTVLSQNIADAKIFLVGKGPLAKHQKPGWLLQMLDFVSPF